MTVHSFDIKDAEFYGILGAVLLHHIRFWVQKNAANRRHYHDGQYWTYNSVTAFSEIFPYATPKQIRKALDDLEEAGVIAVGCYNENPYDRTRWFSCYIDLPHRANEFDAEGKSLTNTDIKPDIKHLSSSDDGLAKKKKTKLTKEQCQLIADKYNEELGEYLPKVQMLTSKRESVINSRFSEMLNTEGANGKVRFSNLEDGVVWFSRLFAKVKLNPHWLGENDRQWRADFDWIMSPSKFTQILEFVPPRGNK